MTTTGRLTTGLRAGTRRRLFENGSADVSAELGPITEVDLAHLVMLDRTGLLDRARTAALAGAVTDLRADGFAAVRGLPRPRGLYLAYEEYLSGLLGPEVGGALHTGRSRNDLNATTAAMLLRERAHGLLGQTLRLHAVLLGRARVHRDTVMPVYTHFQAAMPVTYGHYLLGVAEALGRDADALAEAARGLDRCPLGAGAVAGTDLPIDPAVTADLLGFREPARHSVDAVASRDTHLRLLSAAAGLAVTLSRLACDLQLWSTAEFGLIDMADHLVGGSSAMPQKRNAFLLEHLKAKAGAAIGAWTAAASMTKSTPFTNCIEVGTEAVAACRPGFEAVHEALLLAQVLVGGARPRPRDMLRRAEEGFTTATAVANHLVREGVAFRTAHHAVGAEVRAALDEGRTGIDTVEADGVRRPVPAHLASAREAALATRAGGGPGAFDGLFAGSRRDLRARALDLAAARERCARAHRRLDDAVRELTARTPSAV
ncbi:argininosuccinate lyase [Nocardiopsis lambiniae]|uniref:Argininosuccinate lyase n=1 Tax=Nocardiopsis lambiniae TaxID=3075539 RepID=A0ABU2M5Z7_9ACTN|nr:argininosuccinate lyase [Nocardiopsis sp. DSM 44743]MDT0328081.1 argininosuccinate lyase [Nocardiopsis sp. DSM 44743]